MIVKRKSEHAHPKVFLLLGVFCIGAGWMLANGCRPQKTNSVADKSSHASSPQENTTASPRLTIYFTSQDESYFIDAVAVPIPSMNTIVYRQSEPTITDEHIVAAHYKPKSWRVPDSRSTISFSFTDEGRHLMREMSKEFLNDMLVIMWDGEIVASPVVLAQVAGLAIAENSQYDLDSETLIAIRDHLGGQK